MSWYLAVLIAIYGFLIQGCSQKKIQKEVQSKEIQSYEVQALKIKNLEELNEKVNLFLNEGYSKDTGEPLVQNTHYDIEYVYTESRTYVFVKFKNSMLFCGSGGCSGKLLEYVSGSFKEMESLTLKLDL